MLEDFSPLPREDDKLFKRDGDWQSNACLNISHDQWIFYVRGYKHAADLLVEHIKKFHSDQDFLVYPIVFLYRHYLELQLKDIIKDGNQLLDIPEKTPTHHKINELWTKCRKILEKVYPEAPDEHLNSAEGCIRQLSEKDPFSMAFRYPTDKSGNPVLPGLEHINLGNFAEVINRLSSMLEGMSFGISHKLEDKRAVESENEDYG